MNTTALKRFAQAARRKLMDQVAAKIEYVLTSDSAELREKAAQINELKKELNHTTRALLTERVAYTWFNRLAALRFMDANDYQPTGIRVISPAEGTILPQLLNEAKQGNIPAEWKVNTQKVYDLLDGRIPASNPQNEAYRELLIAACNNLHTIFPFLFERINDYTELLLPDDLTSQFSIVHDVVEGMPAEDCQQVEVLGWLYQFYISEKKDEVFASKSKVKKEDIPAATQLFTPRWIVEYMVQNTVGKLWLQNKPTSKLRDFMPYYIESVNEVSPLGEMPERERGLVINSPEEITLLDQASGSGHILVYGFELLYKIYEEEGYNPSEIPVLILEKNLWGFEIDERAAEIAGFALLMKAREYNRRIFRKGLKPHILTFTDFTLTDGVQRFLTADFAASKELLSDLETLQQATNFGSLIQPKAQPEEIENTLKKVADALPGAGLFDKEGLEQLLVALKQLQLLSKKFTCVVDNPPYMGSGNMNKELSEFVQKNYPDSKADLMACFMESGLAILHPNGFLGMINQHSWMFLSSYEKLREKLIKSTQFDTLLHLGPRTFPEIGGEVVQNAAFTFLNDKHLEKGNYIRLVDYNSSEEKRQRTLEAIKNADCGCFYTASQTDFQKIPGSPIAYWISPHVVNIFDSEMSLRDIIFADGQNKTGNNDKYLRLNWENEKSSIEEEKKLIFYAKGGPFRKWHGNNEYVVKWDDNSTKHYSKDKIARIIKKQHWFRKGYTFSRMSEKANVRVLDTRGTFDATTVSFFISEKYENEYYNLLAYFNSKVGDFFIHILNPTLVFQLIDIRNTPYKKPNKVVESLSIRNVILSKEDWDSKEISWDFQRSPLIIPEEHLIFSTTEDASTLKNICESWQGKVSKQFLQLHQNEEELNRQFIEIYGLQEELTPDVPLEEITILQQELDRKALEKLNKRLQREPGTLKVLNYNEIKLPFDAKEVMAQFVSYAVGCMFGRYSLEKPGLILANQGETVEDYWKAVRSASPLSAGQAGFEKGGGTRQSDGGFEELPQAAEPEENNYENPPESPFNKGGRASMEERYESESDNTNEMIQPVSPHRGDGRGAFSPDADNIIPILDDEWFEDDITARFKNFLKASFGEENFDRNLRFVEECLGKDIQRYFARDFYTDHVRRYKKRPIYWMFSSPQGSFNALIYMHRYTPDTISLMLNNYLRAYQEKLRARRQHLERVQISGTTVEKTQALKETERIDKLLLELQSYERDILFPLATSRISINLDDGVLVNYNKFGKAIREVTGLNDKPTKKKVREFDWIDVGEIRD